MNDFPTDRPRAGPSAQMSAILVSQGRLEEQMNSVKEKLGEIADISKTVADHETRIIVLESKAGVTSWVWNTAWALVMAAIGGGVLWLGAS